MELDIFKLARELIESWDKDFANLGEQLKGRKDGVVMFVQILEAKHKELVEATNTVRSGNAVITPIEIAQS